jgi:hypothetical protein
VIFFVIRIDKRNADQIEKSATRCRKELLNENLITFPETVPVGVESAQKLFFCWTCGGGCVGGGRFFTYSIVCWTRFYVFMCLCSFSSKLLRISRNYLMLWTVTEAILALKVMEFL